MNNEEIENNEKLSLSNIPKSSNDIRIERLATVGELSARLAHDLRNPLTVIKGIVEIVKTKNKESQTGFSKNQIAMLERAIASMSRQLDDVLEFVKVQSLHASHNSILETISLSLVKLQNFPKINFEIPINDIEFVYDAEKLETVFDNLFRNAAEAIEYDGTITIRINELENEIEIEIEDSGKGIPNELLEKIFEPLFTTKQKGTGLGLASCKSIIKQHGGSIYAKNNPTTFIIKLPKIPEISTI